MQKNSSTSKETEKTFKFLFLFFDKVLVKLFKKEKKNQNKSPSPCTQHKLTHKLENNFLHSLKNSRPFKLDLQKYTN